jgi:hypothetical protein
MSSPSGPEESERRDDDVERADAGDAAIAVDPDEADSESDHAETDDQQWRFAVDEVGEDAPTRDPLEPESVSLENALFVAAGVLLTVGILLLAVL